MTRRFGRTLGLACCTAAFASLFWGCPSSTPPWLGDLQLSEVVDAEGEGVVPDAFLDLPTEVTPGPCLDSTDCPGGLVCDTSRHACVPCGTNGDCADGMRCADGRCVPAQRCEDSGDCPDDLVCDEATGRCVECTGDGDCPQGQLCIDQGCFDRPVKCTDNTDCPDGKVCDYTRGVCVECRKDVDCPDGLCDPITLTCRPRACAPGSSDCLGNVVAACRADGSGWDLGQECAPGTVCRVFQTAGGAQARCSEPCVPACAGRQCGDDGCGGSCGSCAPGQACDASGRCVGGTTGCRQATQCLQACSKPYADCIADCGRDLEAQELSNYYELVQCVGNVCGPAASDCWDGAIAGACAADWQACTGGACVPSCVQRQCGDDQCGGSCGTCPPDSPCDTITGQCVGVCQPQCVRPDGQPAECGGDGCGGLCGQCPQNASCSNGRCLVGKSCPEAAECAFSCTTQACLEQCAPPQEPARSRYRAVIECARQFCGPAPSPDCLKSTLDGACAQAWSACQNCQPNCLGRECGGDGCGGSCGVCDADAYCQDWRCVPWCTPRCDGMQCGEDGCGGVCGWCEKGQSCTSGRCVGGCVPSCAGKECGDDGCGGFCGSCPPGMSCQKNQCFPGCWPSCEGKKCGDDGCGGSCGTCPSGSYCSGGLCTQDCRPSCVGKQCGPDGCGGTCGACTAGYYCGTGGSCLPSCLPNCAGKACGSDGCGGQCGVCGADQGCVGGTCRDFVSCYDILMCAWKCPDADQACNEACFVNASPAAQNQYLDVVYCVQAQCGGWDDTCTAQALQGACRAPYLACMNCTPNCLGRQCGDDGCGGSCGACANNAACDDYGQCPCTPRCTGRQCGPDGCGGLCGLCKDPQVCNSAGQCRCEPACAGKVCGSDGCGGTCGRCPDGETCTAGQCIGSCTPSCGTPDGFWRQCGSDGCGGSCGTCGWNQTCDEASGQCLDGSGGCEVSPLPGCGGCACEACVCSMDPFCCQGAWDEMCVQQCQQCGGCGGCIPSCTGSDGQWRECGDDGCGGQCGTCPDGWQCNALYQCQPGSRTCQQGIDCVLSCNGPLYSCLDSCAAGLDQEAQSNLYRLFECIGNLCASGSGYLSPDCFYRYAKSECLPYYERCLSGVCTPRCEGRECGDDGCGGQCGTCPWGTACDWAAGYCYPTCIPSCENRQCGDDGCGGTCGDCQPGTTCQDGWCVSAGKACGEVLDCAMTNCASLTQACIQSCMVGASSSAQQLFLSLAQCVVQQCGYPTTAACVQKALQAACYSQAQSCRYDGWVVPM